MVTPLKLPFKVCDSNLKFYYSFFQALT